MDTLGTKLLVLISEVGGGGNNMELGLGQVS